MKEARKAPRVRLGSRLFFTNDAFHEGEARLLDLSKTGCSADSETAVCVGMMLQLSLFLPDYDWQLHIDRSVVRWVRGHIFGLEFLDMRPVQRERLRRLVEKFHA